MKIHELKKILQSMSNATLMRICKQLKIEIAHVHSSKLDIKKPIKTICKYNKLKFC